MAELARRGEGRVHQVAFSPDGRTLAVASTISGASFSVEKLVAVRFLPGNAPVLSMACSPDGRTPATGSWERTIWLWDVAFGQPLRTLEGHTNWVSSVAFSPDRRLASGSGDGTVRLWGVPR